MLLNGKLSRMYLFTYNEMNLLLSLIPPKTSFVTELWFREKEKVILECV